jgi:hypothetical protein
MVCRSRGDEHLCVEADDVLLDAKNAMAAASSWVKPLPSMA